MQTISGIQAGGERPFFAISDTKLSDVTILAGESAFKHGKNLSAEHCRFEGKYPFWHCEATTVRDSLFTAGRPCRGLVRQGLFDGKDARRSPKDVP